MFKTVFNWKDEYGRGRCCMLTSACIFKVLRDVSIGSLYVAFLSANGFSLYDVSVLSSLQLAASFFSIFSAQILGRFQQRKRILGIGKLLYYLINIAGLTIAPIVITDRRMLMLTFSVLVFLSGVMNSIITGGYLTWHSNFVKGESAAYYFSTQQIACNLVGSVFLFALSGVVDLYKNTDLAPLAFLIVRAVALVLALVDVAVLFLPKEYAYKQECEKRQLKDLIVIPFSSRKFILTMGIYSIWMISSGLTDTVGMFHLQNEVGVSMKLMNLYTPLYAAALILTSGLWRRVLQRFSWLTTFAIAGIIHAPSALLTAVVNSSNYLWLYPIAILIQAVAGVGLNLADLNMVYVNTPELNQTYYIGFFSMLSNLAPLLGKLIGGAVIRIMGERAIPIAGIQFGAVRILMLVQFAGFLVCCLLFIKYHKRLYPDVCTSV